MVDGMCRISTEYISQTTLFTPRANSFVAFSVHISIHTTDIIKLLPELAILARAKLHLVSYWEAAVDVLAENMPLTLLFRDKLDRYTFETPHKQFGEM